MSAASPAARLRRELRWTQRQAATRLGYCLRTLQRIEAGAPAWPEAEVLARVYGAALGRPVDPQFELYGVPRPSVSQAGASGRSVQARRAQ
ncbi:MAG TPA: helix-turn-helix transcriptional regulator [Thermomicrobiales bacterium]|nr:helix-turn-helix transcriptional regulator [Thermomicrobiales bacterium]